MNKLRTVLIISYYFPPLGMGGVQRVAKFVRYLPEHGWLPIVLTVKDIAYDALDSSLLEGMGPVLCFRTESFDPSRLLYRMTGNKILEGEGNGTRQRYKTVNRILSWIMVPDTKIGWIPFALKKADKILRNHPIDIIFTTSPPNSLHYLGHALKQKEKIPWVADFRDSWLTESYQKGPTFIHDAFNRWLCQKWLHNTDAIITVSRPITAQLKQISKKKNPIILTLPNGYDRNDYSNTVPRPDKTFTITYCGTLNRILNPEIFLKCLGRALHSQPDIKGKIRIKFIGAVQDINIDAMITRFNLKGTVEIIGYVNHSESITQLMSADMLLLLLSDFLSEGVVTGKIFEYLASGKPVMALVPPGEAERLILKFARGVVVRPHDEKGIESTILRCFTLWARGALQIPTNRWQGIEVFDRRYQTKELAALFTSLLKK